MPSEWVSTTTLSLAAALDDAFQRGVEEERERWRERVEAAIKRYDRTDGEEDAPDFFRRSLLSPAEVAGREEDR